MNEDETTIHRKVKKTFNTPGHAHFLTFSCHKRLPLLGNPVICRWFLDALDTARKKQAFDLWAYVIMPEHVHLLVHPRVETYKMSRFLFACKRPVAGRVRRLLVDRDGVGTWRECFTSEGGQMLFRFWQAGSGYDRNLMYGKTIPAIAEYIHANPVRRGLATSAELWPWSSARYWMGKSDVPLVPDPFQP